MSAAGAVVVLVVLAFAGSLLLTRVSLKTAETPMLAVAPRAPEMIYRPPSSLPDNEQPRVAPRSLTSEATFALAAPNSGSSGGAPEASAAAQAAAGDLQIFGAAALGKSAESTAMFTAATQLAVVGLWQPPGHEADPTQGGYDALAVA
ncbi:MAG TPA: hypothetical protein VF551_00120, partial [Chthoniobacterales bacterium]